MREQNKARKKDQFLRKEMEKLGKFKGKDPKGKDQVNGKGQVKGKGKAGKSMKQTKSSLTTSKEDEKPVLNFKDPLSNE